MPTWSAELASDFPKSLELSSEESYRRWFLKLCGIWGDPVKARQLLAVANATGAKLKGNGYGYRQAFRNSPSEADLHLLGRVLKRTWGKHPTVCDPTAGGGSIPFESIRYRLPGIANDLNPVAASVLRAGIEVPATYGTELYDPIKDWGQKLCDRIALRLEPYFRIQANERSNAGLGWEKVIGYIFARTVACPRTGRPVPLAPNWWLRKGKNPVAVRLLTERDGDALDAPEFEIVSGDDIRFDPSQGTVSGGRGVSPWDDLVVDSDYIKREAQSGRMDSILYAVAIQTDQGRSFRAPTQTDLDSLVRAERDFRELAEEWETKDIIPSEQVPDGNDKRPHAFGMSQWKDMFSPRQLLVHGTFVEEFQRMVHEIRDELGTERGNAVLTELAMMQAKAIDYNARLSCWEQSKQKVGHVFHRHDFAFMWTWGEFDGARNLFPWCFSQLLDAYKGISGLLEGSLNNGNTHNRTQLTPEIIVTNGNGANLEHLEQGSVELLCIDPPYYDNVMYAELADFFYVWEKRTLGVIHPDLFQSELTDKQNEAVANPARFADFGKRRKSLATQDYQAKMGAIFAEADRVLRDDGVMTVMFTHKRAEAWDTLGMALMEAGFTIETSWPVNTESEQSLHQAKKNAAASTIMLVCRKRIESSESHPYFEDLEADVRSAARDAMDRFSAAGIEGVDLLLATYGPALSVISSVWPVYSSEADESGRSRLLRPEEALQAAREELVSRQMKRLVGSEAKLDPLTDFTMLAWDTFRAAEFPFDEARRLALAVGGLDVDDLDKAKILTKKSGSVVLLEPRQRIKKGDDPNMPGVQPSATDFANVIDAVHTLIYLADVDGIAASKSLIERAGLAEDDDFMACLQGLANSIPRTKEKGEWVRPEAATLDLICATSFPDIEIPPDPVVDLDDDLQQELDLSGL